MPVHPQVEALLNQMAAMGAPPLHEQSIADARASIGAMTAMGRAGIAVASVREITIPVEGVADRLRAALHG
jgi:hypothetical protein